MTPPPLLEPPLEEPSLLGIAVQPRAPECWHSRAEWGRRGPTRHILEAKIVKIVPQIWRVPVICIYNLARVSQSKISLRQSFSVPWAEENLV